MDTEGMDRRSFLGTLGLGALSLGTNALQAEAAQPQAVNAPIAPDPVARRESARKMRNAATNMAYRRSLKQQRHNGEEIDYPFLANFSKGLPHDQLGQVRPRPYQKYLAALRSGRLEDFEALPVGSDRPLKFKNPLAGLSYELQGTDSHVFKMRPAPRMDSAEHSAEAAELYWMALARDVRFNDYTTDPTIAEACDELSRMSDFRAPKQAGRVTPATLFRVQPEGNLAGPYISQFLYRTVQFGSQFINQRGYAARTGFDWATDYASWLSLQQGLQPDIQLGGATPSFLDPVFRYIRSGRDLATYVHFDGLYQAYLNACLILVYFYFRENPLYPNAPTNPGIPYFATKKVCGFGTFGNPHIQTLVTEVATRALKAAWYQKWYVHRRMRPEEFGGRLHNHLAGQANYPIHAEILESTAVGRVFEKNGNYLLPQAYQEGCPLHPAYPSGHATVAGACVTVLKAWFDESFILQNPVVPNHDGTDLQPYTGADAEQLTVGGELNKLACNIASGRNFGGIHWRTDMTEGLKLGEEVAISILQEQAPCYQEQGSFSFTKFDGTPLTISF